MPKIGLFMKSRFLVFVSSLLCMALLWPAGAEARKRDRRARAQRGAVVLIEPDALVAKAAADAHTPAKAARTLAKGRINTSTREGIDVSHYQGRIDWDKVAGGGKVAYAYLKATEGASLVDDTYERNLKEARRVGLSVGSYHFYRPNIDWKKQFENLTSVVKAGEQDLIPIIDIEHKGSVSDNHWMIARYRSDHPTLNDGQDYVIWQYTSTGRIEGVKGNVDRSRIMGDYTLHQIQM